MFRDLERAPAVRSALAGLAAHRGFGANLAVGGRTLSGEGVFVSGSYFPVLGVAPALGRLIGPADDQAVGAHPVAVLSHAYWATHLGADPGVVGRTVVVNGRALTVIGVAPEGFAGATLGDRPHVFVPITMRAAVQPRFRGFDDRRTYWAYVFGRLRPGATLGDARRQLDAAYRPILADVEAPLQAGAGPRFLSEFRRKRVSVEPGARGQSTIHRNARAPILLLLGTTGVVLLIACANVANLLLARGAGRAGEMAVRVSLGAGRLRLVRQLLAESVLLGALGGAAGLVVARWTLAAVAAFLPENEAGVLDPHLDARALLFAAAVSLGTGVLFGLFPALHATRPGLASAIRAGAGHVPGGSRAASRFRTSLVAAQLALSMALLASAGLFVRSMANVARQDLGLVAERVVTFGVSPERSGYTPARARALFARLEGELAATPGVTGVAAARVPLLSGSRWDAEVAVEGFRRGPDADASARLNRVSAGYFRALGIPLLAGREFSEADRAGAPRVAVVNEAFARKFNLGRGAVGRRMAEAPGAPLDVEIVGLVRDAKYSGVRDEVPPLFFTPYRQDTTTGVLTFYARTALDPAALLRAVPGIVRRVDAALPVESLRTLPEQARENTFVERMIGTLAGAFAALATLLAAVGLYGVLAYTGSPTSGRTSATACAAPCARPSSRRSPWSRSRSASARTRRCSASSSRCCSTRCRTATPTASCVVYSRWRDGTNDRGPFSAGMVQDLRERNRSFERLAAYEGIPRDAVFSGGDAPRAVRVAWTEPELFRTLGVAAARGRVLRADDAGADTAYNVVVTHAAWQQLLGGDPAAVGRRVRVNGIPRTVVGVLPARLRRAARRGGLLLPAQPARRRCATRCARAAGSSSGSSAGSGRA
jgi:predicted permease